MSLEGNLTAFGLSEILQLIAVQQKSGMLSVSYDDRTKVLYFRGGKFVSTRDRRRRSKDPLRDYLTRYGILSREDLIRIDQLSNEAKLDITDIIVSEGFFTEEEMEKVYRSHLQEEMHELLTWEQCSYKFIPGHDVIEGIRIWDECNVEAMLMESMRRIDEFPSSEKLLPDLNTRIIRVGEPAEDQKLTTNEKTVRGLLNDDRTLAYLIGHARMPRYEVYEAVRHLNEKKLARIEFSKEFQEQLEAEPEQPKEKRKLPNVLPFLATLVLFLAAAAWGAKATFPYAEGVIFGDRVSTEDSVARDRIEARVRWNLEVYYAEFGAYPGALTHLKKSRIVTDSFLNHVSRHSFRYQLTADGKRYTLL
jgi:hypothetical protein